MQKKMPAAALAGMGLWTEQVLHSFAGPPSEGSDPFVALALSKKGLLYGTTPTGGAVENLGTCTACGRNRALTNDYHHLKNRRASRREVAISVQDQLRTVAREGADRTVQRGHDGGIGIDAAIR